jgi:hypothetical protein
MTRIEAVYRFDISVARGLRSAFQRTFVALGQEFRRL